MSKLSHQLVQQADLILSALKTEYTSSHSQIIHLLQFSQLLSKQFQIFSSELSEVTDQYLKQIQPKSLLNWDPQLQTLQAGLLNITSLLNRVSKDIEQVVTIPISLFVPKFQDIYERLQTRANDLKEDIVSIVTLPSSGKSGSFLGYDGVIMNRKRSVKIDISEHQGQYSELIKELNLLQTNKNRTIKSAYQHLTDVLKEIPGDTQRQREGENQNERNSQCGNSNSLALSHDIIKEIREHLLDTKLLKLIPTDPNLEHLSLPELLESRIQNEVEGLLNSNKFSDPHIKSLILENITNIRYFLDCLNCEVESEIVLPPVKYYQLSTMMKHILKLVMEEKDKQDLIHTILLISLRVHSQGRLLIKQLSKDEIYWLKLETWLSLLDHLTHQITKQKLTQSKDRQSSSSKSNDSPTRPKNILSRSLLKFWSNTSDSKQEQNKSCIQILNQINTFLIKLQVPNEFAIKVILSLCQKEKISKVHFEKLIRQQKLSKRESLDRKYSSSVNIKKRKEKKLLAVGFDRLTNVVKHVLPYLGIGDYYQLLQVNKTFKNQLQHSIYKQLLQAEPSFLISKYRINLYKLLLKSNKYSKQQYEKLVSEIPADLKTTQIITQDAKRCLKWAPQHQPLLIQLLQCYSFHHPQTKYLQGMHCLCQRLFHISPHSPHQLYSMFQTLVQQFFKDILKTNFQKLRLKMYQYSRLLQIRFPKLAEHFIKEKLEAEHYIIQWVLTLWGEKQGEIVDVLWDGFVVSGWRWWIKVCVWLLGVYEKELLLLNFDSILKHINGEIEITTLGWKVEELVNVVENPERIREEIGKIKISQDFEKDLELEFDYSDYKLTPFLNTPLSN